MHSAISPTQDNSDLPCGLYSSCKDPSSLANCFLGPPSQRSSPSQEEMTTCSANRPVFTALNREVFLPRSVLGPVERLAFRRFATSVFSVTVFLHLMVASWTAGDFRSKLKATRLTAKVGE